MTDPQSPQNPSAAPKRILIAALGGTIASTAQATAQGVSPQASGEDIAAAAGLDTLPFPAQLEFAQIAQTGSGSITLAMLAQVVARAKEARAAGIDGVVLTQGTDTLEETAFALSVLNDSGVPVAVTGAMRNPTLPGADGPANVRAAIIAAADPRIAMLPAVAVFADEVHDPSFVRKLHSTSVATFSSGPAAGPLGWISEDSLILAHVPATLPGIFPVTSGTEFPQVALIEVGLGDSLALLDALPQAGYAGAVISGVGGGHVPEWAVERVRSLAARMPVVYASRTGSGRTLEKTYGYPGAEYDLLAAGCIPAGRLDARKARLLLVLALAAKVSPQQAFAYFRS